jgi:hypothetical protein
VRAFDHPGGELHYLLCRETLLRNESADNHLTDTERSSGLLHGLRTCLLHLDEKPKNQHFSQMIRKLDGSLPTQAANDKGRYHSRKSLCEPPLSTNFGIVALQIMAEDSKSPQPPIADAIHLLQTFRGADLTRTIYQIEQSLKGASTDSYPTVLMTSGAKAEVLGAAGLIKQLAGQINVVIHALGILLCLPYILGAGEVIGYVSLGAGNTGRAFDLETNQRIAEFKFIRWQGGPESIRQNALFKDFYEMAEHASQKEKFLYVLGTEHGEKFFNSRRAMSSILSRHVKLRNDFSKKFGDRYRTVRDYYLPRKGLVVIQDVSPFVPELVAAAVEAAESEEE